MNQKNYHTIYPVILRVSDTKRELPVREKVKYVSQYARQAVGISAPKTGCPLTADQLKKKENGAPIPTNGIHWSITHKFDYVAGVVATVPIGIDLEKIRTCQPALSDKIATAEEWQLFHTTVDNCSLTTNNRSLITEKHFFRFWTAKEAVLKAEGVGLSGLSQCRITKITDDMNLWAAYQNRQWHVVHFYFDEHIASVTLYEGMKAEWMLHGNH